MSVSSLSLNEQSWYRNKSFMTQIEYMMFLIARDSYPQLREPAHCRRSLSIHSVGCEDIGDWHTLIEMHPESRDPLHMNDTRQHLEPE